MFLEYKLSFEKDVKRLRGNPVLKRLAKVLQELEVIKTLDEFSGDVKKMSGEEFYYRLRIGDFRIGFKLIDNQIELMHIRHRSNIYKVFP